jgi:hypothetical protein
MSLGFIILRHMNDERTKSFWFENYRRIRQFYPENPIMIIDDNSKPNFFNKELESTLKNTTIIQSEYPGRGELLPYIYYLRNKFCDKAVILHDSVFLNKPIELDCKDYKFLWEFEHNWDEPKLETELLKIFNDSNLLELYNKKDLWKGCFGGMTIISYNFLEEVNNKYDLNLLINFIKSRTQRQSLERVLALIFQSFIPKECLLGNIHNYCRWGGKYIAMYSHLPIIKIWSGR